MQKPFDLSLPTVCPRVLKQTNYLRHSHEVYITSLRCNSNCRRHYLRKEHLQLARRLNLVQQYRGELCSLICQLSPKLFRISPGTARFSSEVGRYSRTTGFQFLNPFLLPERFLAGNSHRIEERASIVTGHRYHTSIAMETRRLRYPSTSHSSIMPQTSRCGAPNYVKQVRLMVSPNYMLTT